MTVNRDARTITTAAVLSGVVTGLVVLFSAATPTATLAGSPWDNPVAPTQQVDHTAANGVDGR